MKKKKTSIISKHVAKIFPIAIFQRLKSKINLLMAQWDNSIC